MAFDFGIPVGTTVKSTMDGNVVYAGWNDQGYGNLVIVENGAYRTYYAHLSSIPVSVGDQVTAGTTIGLSGNTGNSTGPHLHYEIRKNKVAIDPTSYMLGS
jgi:murein DD-endopeptidase MepM/ murein hydrolase activator NlpD